MKKEEFAQLLNGRQYGFDIFDMLDEEQQLQIEKNELLVCFGYQDDTLELRGIIFEETEISRYTEGENVYIYKNKDKEFTFLHESDYDELSDIFNQNGGFPISFKMLPIKIQWHPEELDCSWLITTEIPHATFDIMKKEKLYCRGIVLELKDIENYLKN